MASVSRPLVALLVATLALFALWTVALKPSGSSGGGGSQGPSGPASAVAKAHRVAAASATTATGPPTTTTPTPANPRGATPSQAALSGNPATSPTGRAATGGSGAAVGSSATGATGANTGPAALKAALSAHEVVVMLFYNPAGADDQAVKQELDALYASAGTLVLSAPIAQLAAYSSITGRVPARRPRHCCSSTATARTPSSSASPTTWRSRNVSPPRSPSTSAARYKAIPIWHPASFG